MLTFLTATMLVASLAQAAVPALTAPQYRAKADALCAALNGAPAPPGSPIHQLSVGLGRARGFLAALERLRPPPALARPNAQVVGVVSDEVAFFASLLGKLESGRLTADEFVAKFNRSPLPHKEVALWTKLGARVCARK
jgi:hypothetical protein